MRILEKRNWKWEIVVQSLRLYGTEITQSSENPLCWGWHSLISHLHHSFDKGRGTSRYSQGPRRTRGRWRRTGRGCPRWPGRVPPRRRSPRPPPSPQPSWTQPFWVNWNDVMWPSLVIGRGGIGTTWSRYLFSRGGTSCLQLYRSSLKQWSWLTDWLTDWLRSSLSAARSFSLSLSHEKPRPATLRLSLKYQQDFTWINYSDFSIVFLPSLLTSI